jgi:hypothetical protein
MEDTLECIYSIESIFVASSRFFHGKYITVQKASWFGVVIGMLLHARRRCVLMVRHSKGIDMVLSEITVLRVTNPASRTNT